MTRSSRRNLTGSKLLGVAVTLAATLSLAACGGSATGTATKSTGAGGKPGTSASQATLGTAQVAGLGTVVVDARGRTVYALTSAASRNVPCTTSSGCTGVWPPVTLAGGSPARSGPGISRSLLATTRSGAARHVTYRGWLLYEFSGDTGPHQDHGQGIRSFGGVWYAVSPSGALVTATSKSTPTSSGSSSYGSGY